MYLAQGYNTATRVRIELLTSRSGVRRYDFLCREDISRLEYLAMCVKEGLRLHCPVPIVSRHLTKDLNIEDRVLPKGTAIQVIC